jgi:hypothetical protein
VCRLALDGETALSPLNDLLASARPASPVLLPSVPAFAAPVAAAMPPASDPNSAGPVATVVVGAFQGATGLVLPGPGGAAERYDWVRFCDGVAFTDRRLRKVSLTMEAFSARPRHVVSTVTGASELGRTLPLPPEALATHAVVPEQVEAVRLMLWDGVCVHWLPAAPAASPAVPAVSAGPPSVALPTLVAPPVWPAAPHRVPTVVSAASAAPAKSAAAAPSDATADSRKLLGKTAAPLALPRLVPPAAPAVPALPAVAPSAVVQSLALDALAALQLQMDEERGMFAESAAAAAAAAAVPAAVAVEPKAVPQLASSDAVVVDDYPIDWELLASQDEFFFTPCPRNAFAVAISVVGKDNAVDMRAVEAAEDMPVRPAAERSYALRHAPELPAYFSPFVSDLHQKQRTIDVPIGCPLGNSLLKVARGMRVPVENTIRIRMSVNPLAYHHFTTSAPENFRWLLHGCSEHDVDSVLKNGFDRVFNKASAAGKANYLAESWIVSGHNQYAKPNANGVKTVILCQVALGRVCSRADPSAVYAPDGYDCVSYYIKGWPKSSGLCYAVFKNACIYPAFVLTIGPQRASVPVRENAASAAAPRWVGHAH